MQLQVPINITYQVSLSLYHASAIWKVYSIDNFSVSETQITCKNPCHFKVCVNIGTVNHLYNCTLSNNSSFSLLVNNILENYHCLLLQ